MPFNYTPSPARYAEFTFPSGGDPRTAASVGLPMSQLADMIAHVDSERPISPVAIAANADNYNPTNWSDATYVRLASSGAVVVNGANANVLQKRKVLHNIGNNAIALGHLEAGQTAGNQFACLGAVDHALPPGEAATIIVDPVSNVWRAFGGVSRNAAYGWAGTHTWGTELSVAGGATNITTPILNHASNEWSYTSARARNKCLPLDFVPDDASTSNVVWSANSGTGGAVSLNAGKACLYIKLQSGATLTGVVAGVVPGGGTVTLTGRREQFNLLTGAITVTPLASAAASSGAGYQQLTLGTLSTTINNAGERYIVTLQASTTLQECRGIVIGFTDPGPRGF